MFSHLPKISHSPAGSHPRKAAPHHPAAPQFPITFKPLQGSCPCFLHRVEHTVKIGRAELPSLAPSSRAVNASIPLSLTSSNAAVTISSFVNVGLEGVGNLLSKTIVLHHMFYYNAFYVKSQLLCVQNKKRWAAPFRVLPMCLPIPVFFFLAECSLLLLVVTKPLPDRARLFIVLTQDLGYMPSARIP